MSENMVHTNNCSFSCQKHSVWTRTIITYSVTELTHSS